MFGPVNLHKYKIKLLVAIATTYCESSDRANMQSVSIGESQVCNMRVLTLAYSSGLAKANNK